MQTERITVELQLPGLRVLARERRAPPRLGRRDGRFCVGARIMYSWRPNYV